MQQTINVTLPSETIGLIDRVTQNGNRNNFIDEAIKFYVESVEQTSLEQRLKEGALKHAERDLQIADEWLPLEEEAWQRQQA
jgi:CopG family transcriptional regulator / antitoxin EndoAI